MVIRSFRNVGDPDHGRAARRPGRMFMHRQRWAWSPASAAEGLRCFSPCRAAVVCPDLQLHRGDHPASPQEAQVMLAQAQPGPAALADAGLPAQRRDVLRARGQVRCRRRQGLAACRTVTTCKHGNSHNPADRSHEPGDDQMASVTDAGGTRICPGGTSEGTGAVTEIRSPARQPAPAEDTDPNTRAAAHLAAVAVLSCCTRCSTCSNYAADQWS